MSAPQGSGKTTICEELQHLLSHEGYQAVFASLDDFYLTFDAQQTLAKVQSACSDRSLLKSGIHIRINVLQASLIVNKRHAFAYTFSLCCYGCKGSDGLQFATLSCQVVPAGMSAYRQYSKVCCPFAVNTPHNPINQASIDMPKYMTVRAVAAWLHLHHASQHAFGCRHILKIPCSKCEDKQAPMTSDWHIRPWSS